MDGSLVGRTSASLLGRLRFDPTAQAAWAEFVRRYGSLVLKWCRRLNLQEADAEDVTQIVLVKLADRLRTFNYDPARSFRAYVKTVTHYAWCDLLEGRRAAVGSGDSQVLELLDTVEAREDFEERLAAEFDAELLEEATVRVRLRIEPRTWDAFRLTALEGLSGAEAAEKLGMAVLAVFKAKSNVQKMLQAEVQALQGGAD